MWCEMSINKYKISISGLNLHHALAYFEREGFNRTNIERVSHTNLVITLDAKDFKKFMKDDISKAYKIEIIKKIGIQNFSLSLLKHIGILVGLVISFIIIFSSTNHIHSVEFNTSGHTCSNHQECIFNPKHKEKLEKILAENGIEKGKKLPLEISSKKIEHALMQEFKQISGVTIRQKGVKIFVDIKEATLPEKETISNLVSPVSGIIVFSEVISGTSSLKNGDIVLKGQTLALAQDNKPVSATFKIRTFYHENLIYSENKTTYIKTGRTKSVNSVELFGLSLNSKKNPSFEIYQTETSSRYAFFNLFLPFKVKSNKYFELKKQETVVPFESVEKGLKDKLYLQTKLLVPKNAEEKNVTFATFKENDKTRLDCYIESILTVSM